MSPLTTRKANVARFFALALLTVYVGAFDIDAEPDPAQANHPLITPPPKLPSGPQKRDFLDDCFGDKGSCNMYMTVADLCDILADGEKYDLANNQCYCSNGYVPALSMCEDCKKKYNSDIIYPASWASESCTDDGFSIAKMSSKIPLSIEDLVRPTLLPPSGPSETETATAEETETTSSDNEDSETTTTSGTSAESTISKQFIPVGMPGQHEKTTTSGPGEASESLHPNEPQLKATQTSAEGGGDQDAAPSMRGGRNAAMLALAMSGGSIAYYLFL